MRAAKHNRKPTFFWQGLLIVLPVISLAIMGVVFLRQDKALLVQQAKENSQRLSDEIGRYIASKLETQIRAQDNYASWESNRKNLDQRRSIKSESQSGNGKIVEGYDIPLQPYRELIENNLRSGVRPLLNGPVVSLTGELLDPPPYPDIPVPQMDATEALSAQQRELWENAGNDSTKIETFLKTQPPEPFNSRAKFSLALLAKTNPVIAARLLEDVMQVSNVVFSASGLPLPPLAALELMRLRAAGITGTNRIDENLKSLKASAVSLAMMSVENPSALSPSLLEEAVNIGNRFFPDDFAQIKQCRWQWEQNQPRYAFFEDLRSSGRLHPEKWNAPTMFWTTWAGENRIVSANPVKAKLNDPRICGYAMYTVSESLLEVAILEMLDQSRIRLPPYASVRFELFGKAFPKENSSPKRFPYWMSGPWLDLGSIGYVDLLSKEKAEPGVSYNFKLSEAEIPKITNVTEILAETMETWELPRTANAVFAEQGMKVPGFKVQIRLAQPAELFAIQQKRIWVFGSLIAFAAGVALIGFFTAHRAFHRQLRLNEMKSNFVSSVSHELRAPIASIRLMAEGLERGKISEPPKQKEYFHFIMQECRRLSSLIENVLDFSRIEQGRKEYEFELTDVAKLLNETVKAIEPYAEEKQVTLQRSVPDSGEGVLATMDGRAIQQALINLIDNAIKHSPNGAIVKIGLERNHALFLWVEDKGPGIPASEQERIFERFYRLGSELRRETQGVGIGLSIVKHIMDAHGGKVFVQSAQGQGSRFTIEIPLNNHNV